MFQKFEHIELKAVAAAVPSALEGVADWRLLFKNGWQEQLPEQTGIYALRKSRLSTLDLGLAACRVLYPSGERPDAIISVTQTPAKRLPGNASGIAAAMQWQNQGGNSAPLCWDLQMGCAGMIWGLYQSALLLQQTSIQEVLLVCAETHSRLLNPSDRSTRLLFGDGASAFRVVRSEQASPWYFSLGSQPDVQNQLCTNDEGLLHMDGMEIFNFTVGTVVPAMEAFLENCKLNKSQISTYLMHQASAFVLKYMQRMLQIPAEKMPLALDGYGNTASASIGILLAHHFAEKQNPELKNALLAGFGSGLQWGFLLCDLSKTEIRSMIQEG